MYTGFVVWCAIGKNPDDMHGKRAYINKKMFFIT